MTVDESRTVAATWSSAGRLDGIRVVDSSCVLAGPAAGMRLAGQGVDVIKVEALRGAIPRQMG